MWTELFWLREAIVFATCAAIIGIALGRVVRLCSSLRHVSESLMMCMSFCLGLKSSMACSRPINKAVPSVS